MPFIEISGPDRDEPQRRLLGQRLSESLAEAFGVSLDIVTIYFQPVPASHYAHAGQLAPAVPMRNFLKVHAFPRELAKKRRAAESMTAAFVDVTGCAPKDVIVYFFDREPHDVAHGGVLASD